MTATQHTQALSLALLTAALFAQDAKPPAALAPGELTLVTDAGEQLLTAGMCAGFPAGVANAHHLVNRADRDAIYLEVGDRAPGDCATYPDDDIVAKAVDGGWQFTRKDGTPY